MLGDASDPGLGVSFSRGGSAGSGGLEARPAALTCANARGMCTPPEMGMPSGRAAAPGGRTNSKLWGGTSADDSTRPFHLTLFLEAVTARSFGEGEVCSTRNSLPPPLAPRWLTRAMTSTAAPQRAVAVWLAWWPGCRRVEGTMLRVQGRVPHLRLRVRPAPGPCGVHRRGRRAIKGGTRSRIS